MSPTSRLHPRLLIRLAAEYRIPDEEAWLSGTIRDLSAGGVGLLTGGPLPADTILSPLRFTLPGNGQDPDLVVEVEGMVLRSGEVAGGREDGRYRSGVLFLNLRGEAYERVRRFVFHRLRGEEG